MTVEVSLGMAMQLTPDIASQFAQIALSHVTREWPAKLDHVMAGEGDVKRPRDLHPVFYGSFDWHSCVHAYWLLARVLRRFPDLAERAEIVALFESQLTAEKIAGELAYLARPESHGFERPYGWAWALTLAGELARHETDDGRKWASAIEPLARAFANRLRAYLLLADYPVRAGAHSGTAFALLLTLDYAGTVGNDGLLHLAAEKALAWYGEDKDCQAWEPSQDDFLSPALTEAALMSAVLGDAFARWFARFLPRFDSGEPRTLFVPVRVSDRSDGKIAHLDGLNLSRAWCWRLIGAGLGSGHPARSLIEVVAAAHLEAAVAHIAGDYAGEHWLASFALLALDPWPDIERPPAS